jgi:hypothetical protein
VAISANYITMQQQIADELDDNQTLLAPLSDSSLTLSPIKNAIQSAISKWEREDFYFNRFILQGVIGGPFNTAINQEYYGATTAPNSYAPIATLAYINKLWILVSNNRYTLNPRDSNYLDDTSVMPTNSGEPVDYSYDALQIRFYPIPNGIYPIGLRGTQRQTALVNDNDSNVWTQDAYDLIKEEAKLIIGRDVLKDAAVEASAMKAIYGNPQIPGDRGFLYALKAETMRRKGPVRIRPTHF